MDVITVGGAETDDTTPPGGGGPARSALLFAAGGLLVGLTFGVVFAGGDTEPATTTTTIPDTVISPSASPTTTTTTVPVRVERLATMAPGLTDTLVTVSVESSGVDGVTVWEPMNRSPAGSSLPIGSMSTDSLHQWLATVTTPRYSERGALWVGNAAYLEPLAVDVLGMAWHSRLPGELVWTEWSDDEIRLMATNLVPGRPSVPLLLTVLDEPLVPVWWTDAGIVLIDAASTRLTLLAADTESLGPDAGSLDIDAFVAGSPSVGAIVTPDNEAVIIAPDLSIVSPAPWDSSCRSGSFTSFGTGSSLALSCRGNAESTFEIYGIGGEDQLVTTDFILEVPNGADPGWTSDGSLAYVTNANPLRPSTELIFVRQVDGSVLTVTHPGRVIEMESLRN